MSDKRVTMRERTQRFRRRMQGDKKGVSPVVATLILILIAVAAAAALYLWLVAWQGSITGGIGNPSAQATVTIGGSTSVYPFSSLAVQWYEQNHTDVVISDSEGGTGAGMLAVCEGHVEVGAASTPETAAGLEASDGCADTGTITVTTIAYDAVDVVTASANVHGLLSISYDTLTAVYDAASTTGPSLIAPSIDGASLSSGILSNAPFLANLTSGKGASLQWEDIPAAVAGTSITVSGVSPAFTEETITAYAAALNTTLTSPDVADASFGAGTAGVVADANGQGGTQNVNVEYATVTAPVSPSTTYTVTSPCGFTVCSGGAGTGSDQAAAPIVAVERSDASGTTQTFEAKLLGATGAASFAGSFSALGYSGCGSNNYLSDCGITLPAKDQGNGNPGVLALVAGSPNAIGYASDGLARTYSGVGTAGIVPFLAVGQGSVLVSGDTAFGGVYPSLTAAGTIAAGITNSATVNQYSGWRPFQFVTLAPPTGEVQDFITFITDPANNQALAYATGEVSLYSI